MHIRRRRVLEHLITRGILTEAQLAQSQVPHRSRPSELVCALAAHCHVPAIDVRTAHIAPELWELVPFELADKHVLVPLAHDGETLRIAIADPTNFFALDDVKFLTGLNVSVSVADEQDLLRIIHTHHHRPHNRDLPSMRESPALSAKQEEERSAALPEPPPVCTETDAPVVKLVNVMIRDAVRKGAREIVIEPRAHDVSVWFAVDRAPLEEVMKPPKKLVAAMIARLRTMGRGEGWFTLKDVIDVDLRFFPTRFAEPQVSVRLFKRECTTPLQDDDEMVLPVFADAARIEPGPANGQGRVDLHTAKGWRPTWTYPMSRHALLVSLARQTANVDVTDDACANGVRLFLRKRS